MSYLCFNFGLFFLWLASKANNIRITLTYNTQILIAFLLLFHVSTSRYKRFEMLGQLLNLFLYLLDLLPFFPNFLLYILSTNITVIIKYNFLIAIAYTLLYIFEIYFHFNCFVFFYFVSVVVFHCTGYFVVFYFVGVKPKNKGRMILDQNINKDRIHYCVGLEVFEFN